MCAAVKVEGGLDSQGYSSQWCSIWRVVVAVFVEDVFFPMYIYMSVCHHVSPTAVLHAPIYYRVLRCVYYYCCIYCYCTGIVA